MVVVQCKVTELNVAIANTFYLLLIAFRDNVNRESHLYSQNLKTNVFEVISQSCSGLDTLKLNMNPNIFL